ncbi:tyrosine-type recombinase/integrase [Rhodoblastus sp.]|uniref:tyrosine-type recombinase/integrase n=1 Tax=Rhodoblastus sp. TaxID=1962975 RepID=UPI0035B00C0D
MPRGRISKRSVDALSCPAGKDREILWDDALAGFGVAAFPTGKKVYVAQYRQHGRSRRISIGEHGRLTPDEARSQAKVLLGQVETGADPVEERRAERAKETFRETSARFMAEHVSTKRKGRTKEEYQRLLDLHILPSVGSRRLVDMTRSEIAQLHSKLSFSPFAANRALALISAVWNWAAKRDEVSFADNPAKGIERNPERGRERFLTSEEIARLGDALHEAETIGLSWAVDDSNPKAKHTPKERQRTKIDPHAAGAIRLLILTGARLREILGAKWEHVDLERGIIHLPDSKTGAKPIYLSAAAQEVLITLPRIKDNPHVIPGEKKGAPRPDLKRPWATLTRAAGLGGVRIHDLRHSFASFGAGASLGLPIIGKLLGHSQAATTHRYAHLDADPMRRAVDTIGSTINAAMNRRASAEVVDLKTMSKRKSKGRASE